MKQATPAGPERPDQFDPHELYAAALAAGGDPELAREAASAGVHPSMVTGPFSDALGFLSAANFHGVDAVSVLEQAGGDPAAAWELWSSTAEA